MMTFLGEVDRNIKIFIFRVSEKVRFFPFSFRERVVSLFFCTYNAAFPEKLCTYTHTFLKRETTARERTVFCTLQKRKSFQRATIYTKSQSLLIRWKSEKKNFVLSCILLLKRHEFVTRKKNSMSQFKREHSAGACVFVFLSTVAFWKKGKELVLSTRKSARALAHSPFARV